MGLFHEKYCNQIKDLADRMRHETMPPLTEALFSLFETTGNRLKYEEVYFRRRKFLAVFGVAAYVFKRPEDVLKLEEILTEICAEECWALPAHVNRREDKNWRVSVDLFSSETAQALAEIVTLVNGELPKEYKLEETLCAKVRSEIERRVLLPFEQNCQGWEGSDHNWNAVCGGSIGSAAIYLMAKTEEERLQQILGRICHSLRFYLDGFRKDGACMEGIGYFTYGMTYFVGFAEQLLRYSNGVTNLFADEKVQKIAEFQQKMYFASGQTVSFSDGDSQAKFRMGLTAFLTKQYDTVHIPPVPFACDFETDPCYRFMGLMRDYLWTKNLPGEQEVRPGDTFRHDVLPKAQWSICESRNGIGFAIKGGDNGEPHNHNDVGSFFYMIDEEQLICDLGAGEYTGEYFGEGRYNILCNSSEGHSVPVIFGEFQKAGKEYGASLFETDGRGTSRIEFAGAYAEKSISMLLREAYFSIEDGSLTISDAFKVLQKDAVGRSTESITEALVTRGEVTINGNCVIIQGERASCIVQIEGKFRNLRCKEREHFNHEGVREIVRLVHWDAELEMDVEGKKGLLYNGVSKYTIRRV